MTRIHSPYDLILLRRIPRSPDDCARRHRARSAASISQNSYRQRFPASARIGVRFRHRPNAGAQLLLEVAATQERRLKQSATGRC